MRHFYRAKAATRRPPIRATELAPREKAPLVTTMAGDEVLAAGVLVGVVTIVVTAVLVVLAPFGLALDVQLLKAEVVR